MKNISFGNIEENSWSAIIQHDKYHKIVVVIDENVSDLYLDYFLTTFPSLEKAEIIVLPSGEENKCLEICAQVWASMSDYHISRKDLIVNIGGGVTTDMGGFIASCYKRGIDFINIPTTLLSMVDASVGGKTGIDFNGYKNQIGTFANPIHVFIDPRFLQTLDKKELESGFAEMLKHGLIASESHWNKLMHLNDLKQVTTDMIKDSVSIKNNIVQEDPKESGIRKNLNYGHTIGHAIESFLLESGSPLPHGHCIAIGMYLENLIAVSKGILSDLVASTINNQLLERYALPEINEEGIERIVSFCMQDKKNEGDNIHMSLINRIGSCLHDQVVEEALIREILNDQIKV